MGIHSHVFAESCRQVLPADMKGFEAACGAVSTRPQLEAVLGQYWHLLHFFPRFLSALTLRAPEISLQTDISKILYQELGEGSRERAHEVLFLSTLSDCGLDAAKISSTPANSATKELLSAFERGTEDFHEGLGVLFATEATDLAIVTSLANAIRRVTGVECLPWETVHVVQEQDHVECSTQALGVGLTPWQQDTVLATVSRTGRLWEQFFEGLKH